MNKICSTKAPLNKREWDVGKCYKRGRAAGYVAGIQKGIKEANAGVQRRKKQKCMRDKIQNIPDEFFNQAWHGNFFGDA